MSGLTYEKRENQSQHTWQYYVVEEQRNHGDLGTYLTYGIEVAAALGKWVIHDISPDRVRVTHMAELFTRAQLSPLHLRDAVDDMLATH